MKRNTAIRVLACAVTWVAAAPAGAEATPPSWTVQVDPLTTALGFVHVQLERKVAGGLSLYVGPHLRMFNGLRAEDGDDYTGVGVELGVRWFFRGGAPVGYWAQLRGVAARVTGGSEAEPGGYISALGGRTWLVGGRWVLGLGLGVQYVHYAVGEMGTEGWLPAAHTTFGFAF